MPRYQITRVRCPADTDLGPTHCGYFKFSRSFADQLVRSPDHIPALVPRDAELLHGRFQYSLWKLGIFGGRKLLEDKVITYD